MSEPVLIPAGPFLRGAAEDDGLPEERPQRTLFVSAFELEKLPVTFGEFRTFIDAGGYRTKELWSDAGWTFALEQHLDRPRFFGEPEWAHVAADEQPAVGISWFEAEAFARFRGMRLPTEAEWEKAARGTDGRRFPWGDAWDPERASARGGAVRAAPKVGAFPGGASPYGVLELAGGVWEWCSDWFDRGYYARAPERDPQGPATGEMKVGRGGAWNALPVQNRVTNRNAWRPTARFSNLGFRLARSVAR